jgi:hypothetical protein
LESEARSLWRQILDAVSYCHQQSIVHRGQSGTITVLYDFLDLKPENIMFFAPNHVKIIDFGLSNTYSSLAKLKSFCGSTGAFISLMTCLIPIFDRICTTGNDITTRIPRPLGRHLVSRGHSLRDCQWATSI